MTIELLDEPKIEFADEFLCEDPKLGISTTGFFSTSNHGHRSEIHYAVIGTKNGIQDMNDWIKTLEAPIKASDKAIVLNNEAEIEEGEVRPLFDTSELSESSDELTYETNKKLNPDFPGFNKDSVFKCEFQNDVSNNVPIREVNLKAILEDDLTSPEKLDRIVDEYVQAYVHLYENFEVKPDVCFIVITSQVYKKLASIPFGNQFLNFRRKLKASILSLEKSDIPTQFFLEDTLKGSKKQLQDASMIAWNFVTAQYYKSSSSVPWALTEVDRNSCFIGISFHKVLDQENSTLRSSIAQAFNREGKGLIFSGKQFEWNSSKTKVAAPHLQYDYAKELIESVLINYQKINKHTPSRVVIHKTTDFWDTAIHKDYCEIEGLTDGIKKVLGNEIEIDLVTIKKSSIKLLRSQGKYPVLRGTLLNLNEYHGILYTTGYIPYFETYPGVHIPMGLDVQLIGESTLRQVCSEILALTKLNFNNCDFYDSLPITLHFSSKVGEVLQYFSDGVEPPNKYFYYM